MSYDFLVLDWCVRFFDYSTSYQIDVVIVLCNPVFWYIVPFSHRAHFSFSHVSNELVPQESHEGNQYALHHLVAKRH